MNVLLSDLQLVRQNLESCENRNGHRDGKGDDEVTFNQSCFPSSIGQFLTVTLKVKCIELNSNRRRSGRRTKNKIKK